MSAREISVLVLALVSVLVILFCSLGFILWENLFECGNQALLSALRSLVEVKRARVHVRARTSLRLPRAFTALLSCLMNPLAEHENTKKTGKPILLR